MRGLLVLTLQVPVARAHGIYTMQKTKVFRYWRACGTLNALDTLFSCWTFMDRTPLVAHVLYLILVYT